MLTNVMQKALSSRWHALQMSSSRHTRTNFFLKTFTSDVFQRKNQFLTEDIHWNCLPANKQKPFFSRRHSPQMSSRILPGTNVFQKTQACCECRPEDTQDPMSSGSHSLQMFSRIIAGSNYSSRQKRRSGTYVFQRHSLQMSSR